MIHANMYNMNQREGYCTQNMINKYSIWIFNNYYVRKPVAAWSKVCLWPLTCWDCAFESHQGHRCTSVVRYRSLRWADHSSRGVIPTVVCCSVWYRNLVNEEALAHWGLLCQKKKLFHTYQYLKAFLFRKYLHDIKQELGYIVGQEA